MTTHLPVVCQNPTCGILSFRTDLIDLGEGAWGTLEGDSTCPCPACGGVGLIPDGTYRVISSRTLFMPRSDIELDMFERALQLVKQAIARQQSAADFKKDAVAKVPELSNLWDLLPENKDQRLGFYSLVVAALSLFNDIRDDNKQPPPQQVMISQDVLDAIEKSRRHTPDDNRTEPPKSAGR